MESRRSLQPGFTLIELLVAVSIISVLLALMLPTLAQTRYAARDVQCAAQLGQMSVGWETAMVERRGNMPDIIFPFGPERYWSDVLYEAMGQFSSTSVPGGTRLTCPVVDSTYEAPIYADPHFGYSVNSRRVPDQNLGQAEQVNWDLLVSPSHFPLFADAASYQSGPHRLIPREYFAASMTLNWGLGFHHTSETSNMSFGDGHVAVVKPTGLDGPTDDKGVPLSLLDRP